MSTLVATDLDRTMIYSGAALSLDMPDDQAPTLVSVEVLDGRPNSFMTMRAAQALQRINSRAPVVPVTTRTLAQYRRVRLLGLTPRWAITSNGGHLVVDGVPDDGWNLQVRHRVDRGPARLPAILAELRRQARGDWVLKKRTGDDLFCYLVVDLASMPEDFLPGWRAWCAEREWSVSQQGRKIYAIPAPLSKESALAEVTRRLGADQVLAAGDGALDAGFLLAADAAIRPPHGELDLMNWRHPSVTVADRVGVLAADDITAWFERSL